jgi:hypothetical protein
MFDIKLYTSQFKAEWDKFVDESKNGTFLFKRNYMEYHSDRFIDFSLMIYKKEKLIALFPANITDYIIYSHQGLTYGGLIYVNKLSVTDILCAFDILIRYYKSNNIKKIIYKAIPYIYSTYPSQEDLYALYRNEAKLIGCNISSTILLNKRLKITESRKSGIRKANNNHLICFCSEDFDTFWNVLNSNLGAKYDTKPVHSVKEIKYLFGLFPENIKLYMVKKENDILAGTVVYINKKIVHVQYISANPDGKELGALDMLFDYLINEVYKDYDYFDFGQSTEKMGSYLNESLIFQKEGFGGRGIIYAIYELDIVNQIIINGA